MVRRLVIPVLIICGLVSPAAAQPAQETLQAVAFDQKFGESIDLGLTFMNEAGESVALGQLFNRRPVVLAMVYYKCPMLCTLVLNGLTHSLKAITLDPGRDFEVVLVSINPHEGPELASEKKRHYMAEYARPGTEHGWHFLTGDEAAIEQLADAIGYRYVYQPESGEYAHPSGIVVLSPQGRITHYFYNITYPPRDVRLALVESGQGKIGTALDQILMRCFHYDPLTGKYGFAVFAALRAAGALTVLTMAGGIFYLQRRGRRRQAELAATIIAP